MICLGKALTGGFPLSACVGRADLMDAAWPPSDGEAIHTSTFLGHPVGCAMALAQIREIRRLNLPRRSARLGRVLLAALAALAARRDAQLRVRGQACGGVEIRHADGSPAPGVPLALVKTCCARVHLPCRRRTPNVISFTPPLTISARQLRTAVAALRRECAA